MKEKLQLGRAFILPGLFLLISVWNINYGMVAGAVFISYTVLFILDYHKNSTVIWGTLMAYYLIRLANYFFVFQGQQQMIFLFSAIGEVIVFGIAIVYFFYKNKSRLNAMQLFLDIGVNISILSVWAIPLVNRLFLISFDSPLLKITVFVYFGFLLVVESIVLIVNGAFKIKDIHPLIRSIMGAFSVSFLSFIVYISRNFQTFDAGYFANQWDDALALVIVSIGIFTYQLVGYRKRSYDFFPINYKTHHHILVNIALPVLLLTLNMLTAPAFFLIIAMVLMYYIGSRISRQVIKDQVLRYYKNKPDTILQDIIDERTKALRETNKKLLEISETDSLTGLKNRQYLTDKMDELASSNDSYTMFFFELRRFRAVNEIHGHQIGDLVIQAMTERLKSVFKDVYILARAGDDEFCILMKNPKKADKMKIYRRNEVLASRIRETLISPMQVGGYVFKLGMNLSVITYPFDISNGKNMLKYANLSLQEAKKQGINMIQYYDKNSNYYIERRGMIEYKLKNIEYDDEMELYYQPQYNYKEKKITGFEALIRWNSPELGYIAPDEFISVAEESGSISQLGEWIIRQGFMFARQIHERSGKEFVIGINLSPAQFSSLNFNAMINSMVFEYKVQPRWIEFELTESMSMNGNTEILEQLSASGFRIAIDDFGTGYSSLSYLKTYKVNRVKIAKELIDFITEDADARLIVQSTISMCQQMGFDVIAEGVETKSQAELLLTMGCDDFQGYYYSKAVPVAVIKREFIKA